MLATYCESDDPQVCHEITEDDQGATDEVLKDGVNGDVRVEERRTTTTVPGMIRNSMLAARDVKLVKCGSVTAPSSASHVRMGKILAMYL